MDSPKNVGVVGGGLAGLVASILLARRGHPVTLFEKKRYPFHRVCGEYVSNEVRPFLEREQLFPAEFSPTRISRFQLTSVNGRSVVMPLDLGAFGISRYAFDEFLFRKALEAGVRVVHEEVTLIHQQDDRSVITTGDSTLEATVVLCAYGKRSRLDQSLNRPFFKARSPYVGVKYHIKTEHPADLIALHNFKNGYCGISNVENGVSNLCYLAHRDLLRAHKTIGQMEEEVLHRNPFLKNIFQNAQFLFAKPEVINEISFETKQPVEGRLLMLGDAAGMITPLCGNGMAMAIHGAYLASECADAYLKGAISRAELEDTYAQRWRKQFALRLWAGRQIQNLFGSESLSNVAVDLARHLPPVARVLMKNTHGQPF